MVSDRRLRPPLVLVGGSPPTGTIPPGIGHYLLRQSGFRQLHSQAGFKMGIPIRIASFEFPSLVGLGLGFHNPSHNRRSADDPAQRLSYALPNSSHIVPEKSEVLAPKLAGICGSIPIRISAHCTPEPSRRAQSLAATLKHAALDTRASIDSDIHCRQL